MANSTDILYYLTVICNGVAPANPLELTSDPPSSSVVIHSALPVSDAQCMGVKQRLSLFSERHKSQDKILKSGLVNYSVTCVRNHLY